MPPVFATAALPLAAFSQYAALGLLVVMALVFGAATLVVTHLMGPSRQGDKKGIVYESGMNPLGSPRRRFNVRFYMVAMTFLLFDVEIVFLYPWATVFPNLKTEGVAFLDSQHGLFLFRVVFFILTSVIAFCYAWRKGVFRYD